MNESATNPTATEPAASDLHAGRLRARPALDPAKLDRLPPHAIEAEQGVLGCLLWSPNDCMGECITKFKGDAGVFYDLRHQTIYDTIQAMYDQREAVDLITLQQRLKDKQMLDQVGGIAYLSSLQDTVPSAANLSYYLDIVLEKAVLRKMIRTCTDIVARAYENEGEVDTLMDEVERDILRISESRVTPASAAVKDLMRTAINTIEDYHRRQGMLTGLATGFADFDKMTSGLHGGEMAVIAARPSMGKTSLAMNIVEHVILEQRLPVGVFSLEMTAAALALRLLCSRARVNLHNIREGFLSERDVMRLTQTSIQIAQSGLHIDDTSGLSILQLRARARRMHQQHALRLIVVDYLQLLHADGRRARDNRQQEIADISAGLKGLAKELDIPVLVLAQLNRDMERDKQRKPRLSDLRESGAIEQDADLVGMLYRPSAEDEALAGEADSRPVNLLIAKQRNGPTGDVNLTFLNTLTRFESAAPVSDEDVPSAAPRAYKD